MKAANGQSSYSSNPSAVTIFVMYDSRKVYIQVEPFPDHERLLLLFYYLSLTRVSKVKVAYSFRS